MAALSDLPVRLASKIQVTEETGCWLWTASTDRYGYGRCSTPGRKVAKAHRVIYALLVGDPGEMLDHLCRVPACVNPEHLEPVTNRENQLRGQGFVAANSNKVECINGHPFDEANTYYRAGSGRRDCRICTADRQRAYQKRRAA